LFTRIMFEERLKLLQFKPRLLIRKGSFVGVFRYKRGTKRCILTFKITKSPYEVYTEFDVADSGVYYLNNVPQYEQALIEADEVHIIPSGYDLRLKEHRKLLKGSLGGDHRSVQVRLFRLAPLDFNFRFEW
jgi:hypothetical protein